MPSNREVYFLSINKGVSKSIVDFVLQEINGFSYSELAQHLDDEIKDYDKFQNAIERYLNGEMIEYVLNKAYFLSKPFFPLLILWNSIRFLSLGILSSTSKL